MLLSQAKWSNVISFRKHNDRVYLNPAKGKGDVLVQMAPIAPEVLTFVAPTGLATPYQGSTSTKRSMELEIPTGMLSLQLEKLDAFILKEAIKGRWFGYGEQELKESYRPVYNAPTDGSDEGVLNTKVLQNATIYKHQLFDTDNERVVVTRGTLDDINPFVGVIPIFQLSNPWCFPARGEKPPMFGISLNVVHLYVQPTECSASGIDAFSL